MSPQGLYDGKYPHENSEHWRPLRLRLDAWRPGRFGTGSSTRSSDYGPDRDRDGGYVRCFCKETVNHLLAHTGCESEQWSGDGKWARLRRCHSNLVGNLRVLARRVG